MQAYLVETKNPEYSGKVYGIQFGNGRAIVSKETLSPHLGWTLEQVVSAFESDFHYTVTRIGDEPKAEAVAEAESPVETVTPAQGAEVSAKPKRK